MSERSVAATVVGTILALLFACVIGISVSAIYIGDYMDVGRVPTLKESQTVRISGIAGFLAALGAWWLQRFAAGRGFIIRVVYALAIIILLFAAFGGLVQNISHYMSNPEGISGFENIYWGSLAGFYSFVLGLVTSFKPALPALLLTAALYIAIIGPREAPD